MKPFVIGRKNWMFSNTGNGARASAVLYSIIETAKANGLIPFYYLMHILQAIAENPEDIDTLLPWNIDLPQPLNKCGSADACTLANSTSNSFLQHYSKEAVYAEYEALFELAEF